MKRWPLNTVRLYFWVSIFLGMLVQMFKFYQVKAPGWVFNYLNDFLVIPIVATIALHLTWWLKRDNTIRLNLFTIFTIVLIFSIAFEYYLPQTTNFYVSDAWDVVCYILGGVVFYFLQQVENK